MTFIETAALWLANHWAELAAAQLALIQAATIITRLTPTKADDNLLFRLLRLFSLVSKNHKWTA